MTGRCFTYWGSHGCDKPAGHVETGDLVHACGSSDDSCSEMIEMGPEDASDGEPNAAVRYHLFNVYDDDVVEDAGWSEWYPSRWYT